MLPALSNVGAIILAMLLQKAQRLVLATEGAHAAGIAMGRVANA